jgi:transposase
VTPAPARIIPKGLLTESALAWVVVSKFADALPLYRIVALLHRFGGNLSRGTLAASVVRVGMAVQPLINLMRVHLLEADIVYGDETTVQVLKEPGRPAQRKSYMWVQMSGTGPPVRLFSYSPTRSAAQAAALYAGIKPGAVLMTDGYEPYNDVADASQLVHLGCWAHARRYKIEAEENLPKVQRGRDHPVSEFIRLMGQLFAIESRCEDTTAANRLLVRQRESCVILAQIEALLLRQLHVVLPLSAFSKALNYLHGQWPKLNRYVGNGAWPTSNNACENAIRPFTAGRKNWLFHDTVAGANAAANLYSLIQTCMANSVEPYAYLVALLKALPLAHSADDYETLLPWRVGASTD